MESKSKTCLESVSQGQPKTFENMAYGVRVSEDLLITDAPELEHMDRKKKEESCWSLLFGCLMCS